MPGSHRPLLTAFGVIAATTMVVAYNMNKKSRWAAIVVALLGAAGIWIVLDRHRTSCCGALHNE